MNVYFKIDQIKNKAKLDSTFKPEYKATQNIIESQNPSNSHKIIRKLTPCNSWSHLNIPEINDSYDSDSNENQSTQDADLTTNNQTMKQVTLLAKDANKTFHKKTSLNILHNFLNPFGANQK